MRTYPEEFKASVIAKMLAPYNRSIPDLVKETGIPKDTLYTWRSKLADARQGQPQAGQRTEELR